MSENFVLVHGAWHGGWAWQPVASRLRAAGHRVWAPTCPGLGIDDDPRGVTLAGCVDSLVSQVEASFAVDVTLVGHSWGGYVIAGAAPRLASRLKALVFWSAFVPEASRPLYDELRRLPGAVQPASEVSGETPWPAARGVPGAFMGDADPAAAAAVHSPPPPAALPDVHRSAPDEAYRNLGIPLHYVLSATTLRCRQVSIAGSFAERSRASRYRCPAATSPCSPGRPNWRTPSSGWVMLQRGEAGDRAACGPARPGGTGARAGRRDKNWAERTGECGSPTAALTADTAMTGRHAHGHPRLCASPTRPR